MKPGHVKLPLRRPPAPHICEEDSFSRPRWPTPGAAATQLKEKTNTSPLLEKSKSLVKMEWPCV